MQRSASPWGNPTFSLVDWERRRHTDYGPSSLFLFTVTGRDIRVPKARQAGRLRLRLLLLLGAPPLAVTARHRGSDPGSTEGLRCGKPSWVMSVLVSQ